MGTEEHRSSTSHDHPSILPNEDNSIGGILPMLAPLYYQPLLALSTSPVVPLGQKLSSAEE
jgi:hypothetical protein